MEIKVQQHSTLNDLHITYGQNAGALLGDKIVIYGDSIGSTSSGDLGSDYTFFLKEQNLNCDKTRPRKNLEKIKQKNEIRLSIKHSVKVLEDALDDLAQKDQINKSNALYSFLEYLGKLWKLRHAREENFAIVINMLQLSLYKLAPEKWDSQFISILLYIFKKLEYLDKISDVYVAKITSKYMSVNKSPFMAIY